MGEGLWFSAGDLPDMARRATVWLAIALAAALLPSAAAQSLPAPTPVSVSGDHTVVALQVPIVGVSGSGSASLPIDGGVLEITLDPVTLPGPGGTVDVGAYLAQARILLPGGGTLPLPSMVIQPQDQAIEGPAADALAALAAEAALLVEELESLDDESADESPPEPEPEPGSDPLAEQAASLQAQGE